MLLATHGSVNKYFTSYLQVGVGTFKKNACPCVWEGREESFFIGILSPEMLFQAC